MDGSDMAVLQYATVETRFSVQRMLWKPRNKLRIKKATNILIRVAPAASEAQFRWRTRSSMLSNFHQLSDIRY